MKTVVIIPTYNEAGNIAPVVSGLLDLKETGVEILVVDDDSPDGTSGIVARLAERAPRVHLLSRSDRRGRGRAGQAGFLWALDHGADCIGEMDGDGSHDPASLPRLLEPIRQNRADVVIGSRFIAGGAVEGRQWFRDRISGLARAYIGWVLGIPVNDPTSGYRLFTREALESIDPRSLTAPDPFIVTEVLYRCYRKGLRVTEVPIIFRQRKLGVSKLNSRVLTAYLFRVWKLKYIK
ncbi:MAG: polyprenol monophosphomannose synthase [PVC group bacterium]